MRQQEPAQGATIDWQPKPDMGELSSSTFDRVNRLADPDPGCTVGETLVLDWRMLMISSTTVGRF